MTVNAIDHINIRTRDMAATVRFFTELLGLTSGAPPAGLDPARITWMFDAAGRAPVHLTTAGDDGGASATARDTGALHHVALDCSGHAALLERCERLGISYRLNDMPSIELRQIFVYEPNGVLLELNVRGA